MPTAPQAVFHYEIEKSEDETLGSITTVICHGRLVSETSGQIKDAIKDGLRAVTNAIEDKFIVPGAGAFEVAVSDEIPGLRVVVR